MCVDSGTSNQLQTSGEQSNYDPSEFDNFLVTFRQISTATIPPVESSEVIHSHFLRLHEKMSSGDILLDDIDEFATKLTERVNELRALMTLFRKQTNEKMTHFKRLTQSMKELAEEKKKAETEMDHLICDAMSMEKRLDYEDWARSSNEELLLLIQSNKITLKYLNFFEDMVRKADKWYQIKKEPLLASQQTCNLM